MELAGPTYDLDLAGTTLSGLVTLHVPVPRPLQQGVSAGPKVALLVYYDSRADRWQPVNATYNSGTWTLTATSSHLSMWSVLRPDPAQILAATSSTLKGFLGIAHTAQPPCPNSSQLPTVGIHVTADPGDLVSWCADYSGTSAVIRVASNRTYAMEADYLSDWSMSRVGNLDPVTAQILKYLPALSLRVSGPNVRTAIIPGGQEVDLTPPAGASGTVLIGPTAEGILVDAMLYAADTLAMTLGDIPGAPRTEPAKTAKAVALAFESGGCLNEMRAVAQNPDISTPQAAGAIFRSFTDVATSCLADTWTTAYGISGFMAPFYVGTLLWLADGIKLITTDLHALIDSAMYWQGYHVYFRSKSAGAPSPTPSITTPGVAPAPTPTPVPRPPQTDLAAAGISGEYRFVYHPRECVGFANGCKDDPGRGHVANCTQSQCSYTNMDGGFGTITLSHDGTVWRASGVLQTNAQRAITCYGQPRPTPFTFTLTVLSGRLVGNSWMADEVRIDESDTAVAVSADCPAARWSATALTGRQ
jgi:hypothetical protein